MKHGKRYAESAKEIDRTKVYDLDEAIALVKKNATAKFDETIEAHVRMDGSLPLSVTHERASDIERKLKTHFGKTTHVTIHMEPIK